MFSIRVPLLGEIGLGADTEHDHDGFNQGLQLAGGGFVDWSQVGDRWKHN